MKNKRIWLTALSFLLVFSFILTFSSCVTSGGDDTESGESDGADTENETESSYSAEPITLFDGSDADYRIVYSENITSSLRKAVLEFKAAVEDVTGKTVTVATDTSKNFKEVSKEILIGNTVRPETATALEGLDGVGYKIARVNDKICIVGTNDYLAARALSEIFSQLTSEDGKVTVAGNISYYSDCSADMTTLITDEGKFAYEIIIPKNDASMKSAATDFADRLETLFNKDDKHDLKIAYRFDTAFPSKDGVPEILIGKTDREASTALYEDIGYFAYRLFAENGNILIGAHKSDITASALNALYIYIEEAYRSSNDGNCHIPKSLDIKDESYGWTNEVLNVDGANFGGIYDPADGTYLIQYTDADAGEYEAYINDLKSGGMTLAKAYTMGNNSYSLMYGKEANAYVSYIKNAGEIRVYIEKAGTYVYPTESAAEAEGSYAPTLSQLRVDNYTSRANGGMSYVIQLSNGHFIIIDGGYNTPDEAENLYNYLKAQLPAGEKPIIDAWFISHLHGDHFGAFLAFSSRYGENEVELRALYYNFLQDNTGLTEVETWAIKQIQNGAKKWSDIVLYEKLHTGMTLEFTGARVSVICTHEDVYPREHIDANDTTTVIRIDIEGQSAIFLGDCRDNQSAAMLQNFGDSDVLSADIVQWSHHGYEGATKELYEAIDADVILFPLNIVGWQANYSSVPQNVFAQWYAKTNLPAGSYIVDNLANGNIKKIIVAGDGEYQKLILPYTPTGDALLDYNAYFEAHKNDRPVPTVDVGEVIT
ncbi:MAG: MBL fold metallo-hydrolase [Clostridia bacterium]|nr:MBL fold metallo-hydrolase [Clostridia bacterium]